MNRSRIFLSHAGSDSDIAQRVADRLTKGGLEPILDRERLAPGLSFIAFMENALATSDFFLLLWSTAAATRKWVDLEWQSALYRSVEEARAFLSVGRVDDHPLPNLLKPSTFSRPLTVNSWGGRPTSRKRMMGERCCSPSHSSSPLLYRYSQGSRASSGASIRSLTRKPFKRPWGRAVSAIARLRTY